ncbi:MAG: prepilin-type N-terminal cleavage/methylation domain-containing protein [Betaproteobacteria bacterium]|nr:MAG: prepilin-type N-terminal cleavage/methylation domain-containing protein [Betaproteobacteria bacterium]
MRKVIQTGVTLVELLVVIAIVGILAMIAVPNLQSFLDSSRLAAMTSDFNGALALARSEAIKRQTPVTLISAGTGAESLASGWTIFVDTNPATGVVPTTNPVIIAQQAAYGAGSLIGGPNMARTGNREYVTFDTLGAAVRIGGAAGAASANFKIVDSAGTIRRQGALCIDWNGRARYVKDMDSSAC